MCTHALLKGAGVGSSSATAVAAAIQWILRDGIGMMSSVLFAVHFSTYFGDYVKEWRLFADIINDVGLTLDMVSPIVPRYLYLPTLCLSAVCKAACGVSAGATKLCITNHFCLNNNAADVATKENTQETAVTLVGLIMGMILTSFFHENISWAWTSFTILTIIHVYANFKAVSCLKLNTINRSRCWLLVRQFLSSNESSAYYNMSLSSINSLENIFLSLMIFIRGPFIGIRLHSALQRLSSAAAISPQSRWSTYCQIFADEMYCILPMRGGTFAVPMRIGSTKVIN